MHQYLLKFDTCLMHQYLLDASILAHELVHQQYQLTNIDASTIPTRKHRCINNTAAKVLMHQQYHRQIIDASTILPPKY
jgi:hypothetical protein